MLELGVNAADIHREIGTNYGGSGIDILVGVRGFAADNGCQVPPTAGVRSSIRR